MPDAEMDGWGEYRKLVLAQLERLDKCVVENERKLDAMRQSLSDLSARAEANTAALARLSGALSRLFWLVVGAIVSGAGAMLFKWLWPSWPLTPRLRPSGPPGRPG